MTALPTDVALAVARAGIDFELDEESLSEALRRAIADRGGYFDGPELFDSGWRVEWLAPVRTVFNGRTRELALARCLIFPMGESGEIGVGGMSL
jgi:hypothetical protein